MLYAGVPVPAYDILHRLGIAMSYEWTCDTMSALAHSALEEAKKPAKLLSMKWSYDYINIARKVPEQRLDNQDQFDSEVALST